MKPHADSATREIRVVEVRRQLIDLSVATADELELALEAAREAALAPGRTGVLRAFQGLSEFLQSPLFTSVLQEPPAGALDAVLARAVMANPAIRPVIVGRGGSLAESGTAETEYLRARAATRARAIDGRGRDAAVAAEEPVLIAAFAYDPLSSGAAVVRRPLMGNDVAATTGSYPAAVLAVATAPAAARPAEAPSADEANSELAAQLRRRGFVIVAPHRGREILAHSRAAAEYYLGGAAATVAALRVEAAARGEPGAPADLLAALASAGELEGAVRRAAAADAESGWRSEEASERLRYLLGRLANTELISTAPEARVYDMSPLADLYRTGALDAYFSALVFGRESPRLDDFLELAAIRHAKAAQLGVLARRAVEAATRARLYLTIVEEKLSTPRVRAVLDSLRVAAGSQARGAPGGSLALPAESVQVDDPNAVLAPLSAREREVVRVEYENRVQEWAATVNNKCPHVRLAAGLRAATSAVAAAALLERLSKFFARGKNGEQREQHDDWIRCDACGFRALCPHVRVRVKLELQRASYDAIRTGLSKFVSKVTDQNNAYTNFCRICSEKLSELIEEDRDAESLGRFGDLDAGLRTKLWVIALAAAESVRFPTPVDERQFASTVADAVYPALMAAEEAASRRRRRAAAPTTEDEIDPRVHLNAILFVYAFILSMIHGSRGARSREIGFEGVKLDARDGVYAEQMLRRVAEKYKGLISQIEDVTTEFLSAKFIEAYRAVRGEGSGGLATVSPEEELVVQTTTIDPVYAYAAGVARVAGDLPLERPSTPAAARTEFETVLGSSLPDLVRGARESARDPELAVLYRQRPGAEVPAGEPMELLLKGPRVNLYARLYEPERDAARQRDMDAFAALSATAGGATVARRPKAPPAAPKAPPAAPKARGAVTKVAPRLRSEEDRDELDSAIRGYFFESYRLFAMYAKRVTSRELLARYEAELEAARRGEKKLRAARAASALMTYYDFGARGSQQFVRAEVPVTALYDEKGAKHDWSKKATFIYRGADGVELSVGGGLDGVRRAVESGGIPAASRLVDIECSVCHSRQSRVGELSSEKATRALNASFEIDSFFAFYESRCPEGGLHDWDAAARVCRQCGLNSVDGRAQLAYFDKYFAQFVSDRETLRAARAPDAAAASAPRPADEAQAVTSPTWAPDFTRVVRAAQLAGVPPSVVGAIGSMEGRNYEDVVDGKGESPLLAVSDPRILAADAETRFFLSEYATLRNFARVRKPPAATAELLAQSGVPPRDFPSLPMWLPEVGSRYSADFLAMSRSGASPVLVRDFAIQSLCEFVLAAAATASTSSPSPPPWLSKLKTSFATQTFQKILHNQKLLSRPGAFNWAIFELVEDLIPEQVGDVAEDVINELLEKDTEELPDDPFSGENMDYDTSESNPNNEPD